MWKATSRKATPEVVADLLSTYSTETDKEAAKRTHLTLDQVATIRRGKTHSNIAPELPRRNFKESRRRLTDEQVKGILLAIEKGESLTRTARRFGTKPPNVSRIQTNEYHREIAPEIARRAKKHRQ